MFWWYAAGTVVTTTLFFAFSSGILKDQPKINEAITWNINHHKDESTTFLNNVENGPAFLKEKKSFYIFELGKDKPNFNYLSFVESKNLEITKFDQTQKFDISGLAVLLEEANKIKINDQDKENFEKHLQPMLNQKIFFKEDGQCDLDVKVGAAWYPESGRYFLQIILYQKVWIKNDSGQDVVINDFLIGPKIKLEQK